jgi:hypothetical protein
MIKIVVGTVLRDNDPRQSGRTVTLVAVDETHCWYIKSNGQRAKLSLFSIYTDGKQRRKGYSFISSPIQHQAEGAAA